MTQAINSGAINETRFPGAEEGLSLIELIGTVQVVCTVASIGIVKKAEASTTAAASTGSPVASLRHGIGAETAAVADATAHALEKGAVTVTPATATAATAAIATRLISNLGATSTPTASATAGAIRKIGVGATASGSAAGTAALIFRKISSASTTGTATSPIVLLAFRTSVSASTTASASGSSGIGFLINLSGTTTAQALASSVAVDYGITQRAPDERRMFVQAMNRRMEVTT